MDPQVTAALITSSLALVSGVLAPILSVRVARITADNALQVQSQELRSEFMAVAAMQQMLQHPKYSQRSFDKIKERVGGFSDEELRRLLVGAGAVRIRDEAGRDRELWGLRERNERFLE
ncbi:hypothetical protein SAMN05216532_4941 [Streptomyces sp. 2231.1]|uniref:hypothetical protein n=1 Tax=Streptomyces sp. 2231.1 TaxID=1855347 RepID=UPI0008966DAE|nr:hypothetical protein [Streptomyces sp. 2231.1]SED56087.1 hypothetical protein SAMN05216532_4941 [Streptomyces sp. 2231.1]